MEKDSTGGGRRFKSGLSRSELLLGSSSVSVESEEDENMRELKEEEVMWAEEEMEDNDFESPGWNNAGQLRSDRRATISRKIQNVKPRESSEYRNRSAPVNVPRWPSVKKSGEYLAVEEEDEEEEMVLPPHKIVAHNSTTTSFSVVEGFGRTLKGRDLSQMRNAVLRQTGFLD